MASGRVAVAAGAGQAAVQPVDELHRARRRQVHVEDCHLEVIGRLAVFRVLEDDADELVAHHHFDGVLLVRPGFNADGVEAEEGTQVFFDTQDFGLVHGRRAPVEGRAVLQPEP
jgi:hypothetical protein